MKTELTPEKLLSAKIISEFEKDRAEHKVKSGGPTGNLTASMLGDPYQWIILKMLGVEARTPDEYVLRLFKRGDHAEEFLIKHLNPIETQKEVEYLGVTGRVDAMVDTKDWDNKVGIIPLEVKSVKNSAYKWIVGSPRKPSEGAKRAHKLQATLYALATKSAAYGLTYLASDDYRSTTFIGETADLKDEVETIISTANNYLAKGTVPKFVEIEKWQSNPIYCKYPAWQYLSEAQIEEKLKLEYPESFNKLKGAANAQSN